jgi:hypothetical protein
MNNSKRVLNGARRRSARNPNLSDAMKNPRNRPSDLAPFPYRRVTKKNVDSFYLFLRSVKPHHGRVIKMRWVMDFIDLALNDLEDSYGISHPKRIRIRKTLLKRDDR